VIPVISFVTCCWELLNFMMLTYLRLETKTWSSHNFMYALNTHKGWNIGSVDYVVVLKLFHAHFLDACYYISVFSFMGISVQCDASKMCHSEVNTKNSGTKLIFTSTSLAYVNNEAVPVVCTVYIYVCVFTWLCMLLYATGKRSDKIRWQTLKIFWIF
jgi:hypothetical protein